MADEFTVSAEDALSTFNSTQGGNYKSNYDDDSWGGNIAEMVVGDIPNIYAQTKKQFSDNSDPELVDFGLYKKEVKKLEDQSGLELFDTGVSAVVTGAAGVGLSSAAWALLAGGTMGPVGLAAAGLAFGGLAEKSVKKLALKKGGYLAAKKIAKSHLTEDVLQRIAKSIDLDETKLILNDTINPSNNIIKGSLFNEKQIESFANVLQEMDNPLLIKKALNRSIDDAFEMSNSQITKNFEQLAVGEWNKKKSLEYIDKYQKQLGKSYFKGMLGKKQIQTMDDITKEINLKYKSDIAKYDKVFKESQLNNVKLDLQKPIKPTQDIIKLEAQKVFERQLEMAVNVTDLHDKIDFIDNAELGNVAEKLGDLGLTQKQALQYQKRIFKLTGKTDKEKQIVLDELKELVTSENKTLKELKKLVDVSFEGKTTAADFKLKENLIKTIKKNTIANNTKELSKLEKKIKLDIKNKLLKDFKANTKKIKGLSDKQYKSFLNEALKVLKDSDLTQSQLISAFRGLNRATSPKALQDVLNAIGKKTAIARYKQIQKITKVVEKTNKHIVTVNKRIATKLLKDIDNIGYQTGISKEAVKTFKSQLEEITNIDLKSPDFHPAEQAGKIIDKLESIRENMAFQSRDRLVTLAISDVKVDYIKRSIKNNPYYSEQLRNRHTGNHNGVAGLMQKLRNGMFTMGFNGGHYTMIDDVIHSQDSLLHNMIWLPQKNALDEAQLFSFNKRETGRKLAANAKITNVEKNELGLMAHINRADKAAHKWIITDEKLLKKVYQGIGGEDFEKLIHLDNKELAKLYKKNKGKKIKKAIVLKNKAKNFAENDFNTVFAKDLSKMSETEKIAFKEHTMAGYIDHVIVDEMGKILRKKYSKNKKVMKYYNYISKEVKSSFKRTNQVSRTYSPKYTLAKEVDNYTVPAMLEHRKGAGASAWDIKASGEDAYFEYDVQRKLKTDANKEFNSPYASIFNRGRYKVTNKTYKSLELNTNIESVFEKHIDSALHYEHFKPVAYELNRVFGDKKIKEIFGENLMIMFTGELKTNAQRGFFGDKKPFEKALDFVTNNAAFAVLGAKLSPIVAQVSAIPEYFGTFPTYLTGVKYWGKVKETTRLVGSEVMHEFHLHHTGEYSNRLSKGGSTAFFSSGVDASTGLAKERGKLETAWETAQGASLLAIKKADEVFFQHAMNSSYIYQLERAGLRADKKAFDWAVVKSDGRYKEALQLAQKQVADGMGSVNIANKAMFIKAGALGTKWQKGEMQSVTRAYTIFQSFVYNSAWRVYNRGYVQPSKMWKAGQKQEAAMQVANLALSELVGKSMYIVAGEKTRRLLDVATGGDGSSYYDDNTTNAKKLGGEFLQHVPIIGSFTGNFEFSREKGMPTHVSSAWDVINNIPEVIAGFGDDKRGLDKYGMYRFAQEVGTLTGIPGTVQILQLMKSYERNHLPEYEKAAKLEQTIRKQANKEDGIILEGMLDGDDIAAERMLYIKQTDKKRYKKLHEAVQLHSTYTKDEIKEFKKIKSKTNKVKAIYLHNLPDSERTRMIKMLKDNHAFSTKTRKELNKLKTTD